MVSHIYRHVLGINVFSLQLSVTWEKLETVYVFFKPGSGCIVRCISFLYLFLRRNFTMILTVPNKKFKIKDLRKQWVRPPPPPPSDSRFMHTSYIQCSWFTNYCVVV